MDNNTKKRLDELEAMMDKDSPASTPDVESTVFIPQVIEPEDLTDKNWKFIDEYMLDLDPARAAIRAGYTERSAAVQAHRMLKNDKIRYEISKRQQTEIVKNGIKRSDTYQMILDTIYDINLRIAQDQEGEFVALINAKAKYIDMLNKMGGFYSPDINVTQNNFNGELKINIVKPNGY